MSRIGNAPVALPGGVSLDMKADHVQVKGPKGNLAVPVAAGISVKVEDGVARCSRRDDSPRQRALHGLTRALLANAVKGVSEGYERTLLVVGTGYRAEAKGNGLTLSLGFSHPVEYPLPEGISARVEERNTVIVLSGIDKQKIGQVAAEIRALRPPDAYKGKGVRYKEERIHLKPGKAAGK
ncbi:MAG: 50S ribosomal protein L6 [Acidobacteriota bacterium]|nr:50S ribosomal protein L6 [Acidobacteriota bacterium]MDQ7088432.1 50S ribosomal protein L6 [Acidobacteriota bacterium]